MIILDCVQGSPEWVQSRLGIPTASQFHRILTPKTRKPSASARDYRCELLAEWFLGLGGGNPSPFMERGTANEPDARRFYEFERDVEVQQVGFMLNDERTMGASPDGLVGDDGLVEFKVPSAHQHIGYLLYGLEDQYMMQCYGQMLVSGRDWVDLVAYHPSFPPVILRVVRDEEICEELGEALRTFIELLEAGKKTLLEKGCRRSEIFSLTEAVA